MNNFSKNQRVLLLAPHIDDVEFGCGGTISRLIENKCQVKYVAFSDCEESLPEELSADTLRNELVTSALSLGISNEDISVLDFQVRCFERDRQRILQTLVDLKKAYQPDLIFTPSSHDIHQDHRVISKESIRAYKDCSILGYELPWNCFNLPSQVIIELTEEQLAAKISAVKCYKSQSHRPYHNENYLRSLATTRGLRINKKFAEAFEPIRIVW